MILSTFLLSALATPWPAPVTEYVLAAIRKPDPGSTFDETTKELRRLPEAEWIPALLRNGYDGLLLCEGNEETPIGACYFQRLSTIGCVSLFFVRVEEPHREKGYMKRLGAEFLEHVHAEGFRTARIGKGGDPRTVHLWELALKGELGLSFAVRKGSDVGEIILPPR